MTNLELANIITSRLNGEDIIQSIVSNGDGTFVFIPDVEKIRIVVLKVLEESNV